MSFVICAFVDWSLFVSLLIRSLISLRDSGTTQRGMIQGRWEDEDSVKVNLETAQAWLKIGMTNMSCVKKSDQQNTVVLLPVNPRHKKARPNWSGKRAWLST